MNKFTIRAQGNVVHIDVIGIIDEWDGNDFATFSSRVTSFLPDEMTPLVINITSHGGRAYDGLSAYTFIKSLPNPTTANIYGIAGSAATHFAVAADHTTIGELDTFFIHESETCIPCGNKRQLQASVDAVVPEMNALDDVQIRQYVAKTGKTEEEIEAILIEAKDISAQRALEIGFVDEIRPDSSRSRAARETFLMSACRAPTNAQPAHPTGESPMDLTQLLELLNGDTDLRAQVVASIAPNYTEQAATITALNTQVSELNTTIAANAAIIAAHEANTEVSDEQRAEIYAQAKTDIEAAAKTLATITAQVEECGLTADGDDAHAIMANALEQAGSPTANLNADSMTSVWAAIYAMRKGTNTDDGQEGHAEINALAGQQAEGKVVIDLASAINNR